MQLQKLPTQSHIHTPLYHHAGGWKFPHSFLISPCLHSVKWGMITEMFNPCSTCLSWPKPGTCWSHWTCRNWQRSASKWMTAWNGWLFDARSWLVVHHFNEFHAVLCVWWIPFVPSFRSDRCWQTEVGANNNSYKNWINSTYQPPKVDIRLWWDYKSRQLIILFKCKIHRKCCVGTSFHMECLCDSHAACCCCCC